MGLGRKVKGLGCKVRGTLCSEFRGEQIVSKIVRVAQALHDHCKKSPGFLKNVKHNFNV